MKNKKFLVVGVLMVSLTSLSVLSQASRAEDAPKAAPAKKIVHLEDVRAAFDHNTIRVIVKHREEGGKDQELLLDEVLRTSDIDFNFNVTKPIDMKKIGVEKARVDLIISSARLTEEKYTVDVNETDEIPVKVDAMGKVTETKKIETIRKVEKTKETYGLRVSRMVTTEQDFSSDPRVPNVIPVSRLIKGEQKLNWTNDDVDSKDKNESRIEYQHGLLHVTVIVNEKQDQDNEKKDK